MFLGVLLFVLELSRFSNRETLILMNVLEPTVYL